MAATASIGEFLDELKIDLDAITPGLDGVRVFTAPVDEKVEGGEAILLGHEAITAEWRMQGPDTIAEHYSVPCRLLCFKPGGTNIATTGKASETQVSAARDRALAILHILYDQSYTDHHASSTVEDWNITGVTIDQAPYEQGSTAGRICAVTFTIEVSAMFTPA
jgi:hypothetical protein